MNKKILTLLTTLIFPALIMATNTVTWTLPTGGESYNTGETVTIQWTSDFYPPQNGSINLYQNGTFIQTIDPYFYFYSGSQMYSWTIPSSVTSASDYQIELNLGATNLWYSSNFSISNTDDDGSIELLTGATESGIVHEDPGYPINAFFHDVKHQSLYLASDLSNAGILSGSSITGIKLKVNETPGETHTTNGNPDPYLDLDSVRIAYNWTSSTEISSFDTTTTVVHGPTNYYYGDFLPNNWVQFDFNAPVTWDGFSNLIIEYSHDNESWKSGGGTYMRNAGTNRGRRGWTDSNAGHYPFPGTSAGYQNDMSSAPDSKVAS
ncbi:MAG: Ser-Thr-rich GPI-anchored membrane family protein, partial [Candidatus Marinimicrobia bacterium]|nr:Ser-Thr-rich GPI-anchored membrane family protein [Candidatus Neomarinimicrobiota bacterium]